MARCGDDGACFFADAADGATCDDGDRCTLGDTCAAGVCQPGAHALLCDDLNPCTDDRCDPTLGCVFTPNDAPCDDGNPCTEGERCAGGFCAGGTQICECAEDTGCPSSADRCAGVLVCDDGSCVIDPSTVVTCPPPTAPCQRVRCEPTTGECVTEPAPDGTPCTDGDPCTGDDACASGECVAGATDLCPCPDDMVKVAGTWCLDRYEASRPDATAASFGTDTSRATSRPGVLPWFPVDRATGLAACTAAGKRLCRAEEIEQACRGPAGTTYAYGDAYEATTCNGIDAFCYCGASACANVTPCPYPRCYSHGPTGVQGEGCGAAFSVVPTGSFPGCVNAYGAYDLSGNVWVLVDTGTSASWYKAGAYNCLDSPSLHRCDGLYQGISARGFRCCAEPAAPPTP